jgi:competence protein ComGC
MCKERGWKNASERFVFDHHWFLTFLTQRRKGTKSQRGMNIPNLGMGYAYNKSMKCMLWKVGPGRHAAAFTRTELVVVIVIVAFLLLWMIIPALARSKQESQSISCINNMKQVGTAYRVWENDNGDRLPASIAMTNGGWNEVLARTNAGAYCWVFYSIMSNDLGQMPSMLTCPADERRPATNFEVLKDNSHLSYFVGASANDTYPQSILGGDRNLGPGTVPDPDYGFSPANGMGNDVVITGPVCWSLKMHSSGNTAGAGNILLGDGSAQQIASANFRQNWQPSGDVTTNWPAGHVPSSPSFRVIFP